MTSQSYQLDDIVNFIEPDKQKIALNVTFQTAFILAEEFMRLVFGWDWLVIQKQIQNLSQRL
jgi:hypothetical protein